MMFNVLICLASCWLLWLSASLITFASSHPVDWSAPGSTLLLIAPIPMLFTSIRVYRKYAANTKR